MYKQHVKKIKNKTYINKPLCISLDNSKKKVQQREPKLSVLISSFFGPESTSTYKTTGVVVADSLGVSESFQEGIGLQDDVFHVLQPPQHKGGVR